jgi:hypothetical protein
MLSRVKNLIGITEEELIGIDYNDKEKLIDRNNQVFINTDLNERTNIGQFTQHSIHELKTLLNEQPQSDYILCEFHILENIDIGQLKVPPNSLIQVASNFNCLEAPSRKPCYLLVENSYTDLTQGPSATFGSLSGYLYRAHFLSPINLLENVSEYFGKPINGKITLTGKEKKIDNIDHVVDNIKVGLHINQPVLYDRSGSVETPILIDQCFNSTINLKSYGVETSNENLQIMMRCLLRSAYESVFLCAILQKKEHLYLTLIGSGSFENPDDLILEELVRSYNLLTSQKNCRLKNVYLCLHESNPMVIEKLKHLILRQSLNKC